MTINQRMRIKNNKLKKSSSIKVSFFTGGKPQLKGITLKVFTMTPKKPNSAIRKVANIKLNCPVGPRKQTIVTAYIPGERHKLSIHNLVLVQPGKTHDLPGVKYKIIRGVLDCK